MEHNRITAMKPQRLNLAILTYNALAYTKLCLDSIERNTCNAFNVFVLDNGSTDGSRDWLSQKKSQNFYYAEASENLGVPGGRNSLIELINPLLPEDGFIIFLDNDMELKPGWDEDFLSFLADHPEAGIVSAHGHRMIVRQMYRELLPAPAYTAAVDVACGGFACWIRAATIRAVGPYDTRLGKFWHEDDDYSVRAIAAGYDVYALPHAKVVHHEHKSGAANPGIKSDGSPENQAYLCDKWRKLGVVDGDGRIRRRAKPRGTISLLSRDINNGSCTLLNQGGYVWLPPEIILRPMCATGAKAGMVREELFKLKCAKAEYYEVFPFQVEVSVRGSQPFTINFTESDQEHEVLLAVDTSSEIKIHSSSGFSPVFAGLGAHHIGSASLQFHGSSLWHFNLCKSNFASNFPLTLISSIFETDGYAEVGNVLIPHLLQSRGDLRVEAISVNERILATQGTQACCVPAICKLFSTHFVGGEILIAADPLDHYGNDVYADVRRTHPGIRKLTAFVLVATSNLGERWICAARGADEVWVMTEAERQVLIASGLDARKIVCLNMPISHEIFRPLAQGEALIPGRLSFLARVSNADDPLLQCCVRAFCAAFTATDPVALVLSISPSGVQLSSDVLKRIVADPSIDVSNMAPVLTLDIGGSNAMRNQIYNQFACMITCPHREIRIELLEAASSGLSILYSDGQGSDWLKLDWQQINKSKVLDELLFEDIIALTPGWPLGDSRAVQQLALSMRDFVSKARLQNSKPGSASV